MVQGLERRIAQENNSARSLRSMATIEPARLPSAGGPASSPRLPNVQLQTSTTAQIMLGLGEYVSGELDAAVKKNQERSQLDGAMAAQQGKSFEDVEMQGDKWALEGYQVVQAQKLASSLLIQQQTEIAQGGYEQNPDQFRQQWMSRVDGMLASAGSDRTRELAKEQLLKAMPTLADSHMTQYLDYSERKNFEALESAVDTISLDPTAGDTLIAFAEGAPGSATSGLSEDRRREAVTSGLVRAFENDNPAAYAVLAGTGNLKALPVAQRQSIEAAKRAFESRNRSKYNADLIKSEAALMEQIESGDLQPQAAMEAYVDLYAQHDITITQQEAGAVYGQGQQGVRTKMQTTGVLIDEAALRGDRATEVDLIIGSLSGTESGGNTQAHRTNLDGRSFSGELQFGDARMAEYNKATGSTVTREQFRFMNSDAQAKVNRWHVNDILNVIEAEGFDNLIGTQINGVTVTRSGLVAVAHLGGIGGMKEFVRTKGAYNKQDELGTSLTDYLRKHATGNVQEYMTPVQQQAAAERRVEMLRERGAIAAYEQSQPLLDQAADEYRAGGSRQQYLDSTAAIREQFGIAQTMASAKQDMDVMAEVRKVAGDALDEAQALAVGVETRNAEQKFTDVSDAYTNGTATAADMSAAQEELMAERRRIQKSYGVALDADAELAAIAKQDAAIKSATAKRLVRQEEDGLIAGAVASGTLTDLPDKLRQRAVKEEAARLNAQVSKAVQNKEITPEQAAASLDSGMTDFYVQSGLVDPNMKRVLNGFLAGGAIDAKGMPKPEYIEAANKYREFMTRSPDLAAKYVTDEYKDDLNAILEMAGDGALDGAIATVGRRKADLPRTKSIADFMTDPAILGSIDKEVRAYMKSENVGTIQQWWGGDTVATGAWRNTSGSAGFDPEGEINRSVISGRMTAELEMAYKRSPHLKSSELVSATASKIKAYTPIIGGIAVPLPLDGLSMGERLFGAAAHQYSDIDAVSNAAVMDYLRTPEFQEAHPVTRTFAEWLPDFLPSSIGLPFTDAAIPLKGESLPGAWYYTGNTGVRPFQTSIDPFTGEMVVQMSLPSGGYSEPIPLDLRKIGKAYHTKHLASSGER